MAPVSSQLINSRVAVTQAVLGHFFSAVNIYGNPLSVLVSSDRQSVPEALIPAITRYAKGLTDRPFLLPFASQTDVRTCWLACAHDELSARGLRDEMRAFIGPSFGDFEDDGADLSADQETAKSILTKVGLHVTLFFAITPKFEPRVITCWQRYWQLLEQRPLRTRQELRTFHQLRADFDRALLARNEKEALASMAALRDQHGLSAENRAFLEIRLNAAFGRWDRILAHPQWDDLLKVRLPPETYGDIWDALYETYLAPVEAQGVAEALITTFAEQVRIMAASLLKSRGRSRRPTALKGFLLHELSLEHPSSDLCVTLLDDLGSHAFGSVSEAIAAIVQALHPKSGFEQAVNEMKLERYEQAISLLQPLADSIDVLQAQLRCAKEIGDPVYARKTLERIDGATPDLASELRRVRPRLLADVQKMATAEVRSSSLTVLQGDVISGEIDDVVVYWRELVRSSEVTELLGQPGYVKSLLSTIEDFALDSSSLFDSLLPIWFDWLVVRTSPSRSLVHIYLGFIEALHVRDRSGESEREMMRLAIRHALIAGLTPTEYVNLVDRLSDVLSDMPSPREIAWSLEVADLLMVHSCRDEEARLRWISRVVQTAKQTWTRLSPSERLLLQMIAKENGLTLPVLPHSDVCEGDSVLTDVQARVLLYSLDVQAIQRAALLLEVALPKAKIDINSDEICTASLKTLSRNADWIVFVSSVATHQAFFCIKSALRKDSELLQVEGSGTTRIVDRVIRRGQFESLASSV